MSDLARIMEAVDFIEINLREPLAVSDIADAVAYSVYHFCRVFNEAVHHTPYDYVMRRKLSEAARGLMATNCRIIDVAFDYGFSSPEIFTRAFKRMFAQTPSTWRQKDQIDRWRFMERVSFDYLAHIDRQGDGLKPQIMVQDEVQLAGLMTIKGTDQSEIRALWNALSAEMLRLGVEPRAFYGLQMHSGGEMPFYMAAVEAAENVSAAFANKTLPASHYACFTHTGPPDTLPLTLAYIYQTWLPQSDKEIARPFALAVYDRFPHLAKRCMVWLPVQL